MLPFDMLAPQVLTILAGLSACPAPDASVISLTYKTAQPVYIKTMTAEDIRIMQGRPAQGPDGSTIVILGMTKGDMAYGFDTAVKAAPQKDGKTACLSLDKAALNILYAPKVFIAYNYLPVCRFEMISAHEQKHIATDLAIAKEYMPKIRKAWHEAIKGAVPAQPVPIEDLAAKKERIREKIAAAMQPLRKEILAERQKRQAVFDTPEAYARDQPCTPPEHWFDKFLWWCCNKVL